MELFRETMPPFGGCVASHFSAPQRRDFPQPYLRDNPKRKRSRLTFLSWPSSNTLSRLALVLFHTVTIVSFRKLCGAMDGRAIKNWASGSVWTFLTKCLFNWA